MEKGKEKWQKMCGRQRWKMKYEGRTQERALKWREI
jgi:hypothetical protein